MNKKQLTLVAACLLIGCHQNALLELSDAHIRKLIDGFQQQQSILIDQASTWDCAKFYLGQMTSIGSIEKQRLQEACTALSVSLSDYADRNGITASARDFQQPAVWGRYQIKVDPQYVPRTTLRN